MERTCENCKHFGKSATEYPCQVCVHNALDKFEAGTNADHIRAMSDEKLAEFLSNVTDKCRTGGTCHECHLYDDSGCSKGEIIEWLQQPRKVEE